jgi:hypothetical protein
MMSLVPLAQSFCLCHFDIEHTIVSYIANDPRPTDGRVQRPVPSRSVTVVDWTCDLLSTRWNSA